MNASWFRSCAASFVVNFAFASNPDLGGRRSGVGGELVDEQHLRCVVAEVFGDLGVDERRHLLTGACPDHRGDEVDLVELDERVVNPPCEFERCCRVVPKWLVGYAIERTAVFEECGSLAGGEHAHGVLDRVGLAAEPVVDDVAGVQEGPCGRHRIQHRRRVDRCIGRLRKALGAPGQELVAQLAGPCERRQHAHRFGDIVEDLGCLAVPIGRRLVGHQRTVAGNGAGGAAWSTS